jgi:hypothetical protein
LISSNSEKIAAYSGKNCNLFPIWRYQPLRSEANSYSLLVGKDGDFVEKMLFLALSLTPGTILAFPFSIKNGGLSYSQHFPDHNSAPREGGGAHSLKGSSGALSEVLAHVRSAGIVTTFGILCRIF